MTAKKGETRLSIIIPAKNEAEIIGTVVESVRELHPQAEILVVNDGSDDETGPLAEQSGATVVTHPVSLGNGAAIKSGARAASGDVLVMMDGDGQHKAADIQSLIDKLDSGYSMAIGARDSGSHAGIGRLAANGLYNVFASMISGHRILDLTSGFRAVRADLFKKFLYLLPNGFSYPTTITMAFLRSGYPVTFVPIKAEERTGTSHIRPVRDGLRFLAIIFKVATLYAPLKVFLPISGLFFVSGIGYYAYTYFTMGRFTNMSMLILSASVIIFLIGLISEQITALTFTKS
ncbi:MAG: glycosyltransferase family 2 protein [Gammaproteobacteria bacterium]|jgi:glycosyltransferase involved in cell wall biosynthesis|nr:glycosyltransferase family 2 protein [Gammaproteobacteria bacterium]MDH4005088.1 glycosyltransferase family 2 protein [Gammaproteobacteria bacterium]